MPELRLKKLEKMIAWGQYIHWANLQYEHRVELDENCSESIQIGVMSHWIASQYVVIEGWFELGESDKTIDGLLEKYPDFIDVFRRCRNAVYHYQDCVLDKRIQKAFKGEEEYNWLVAIKWEFERYLYLYPFKEYGMNKESLELSYEYFGCIGWKPNENYSVRWFEIFNMCQNYIADNDINDLERNEENDNIIANSVESLKEIIPNFLLSKLSRINE